MPITLFENCTLLDTDAGTLAPGTSVLVDGDRIVTVRRGTIEAPPDARRIDGRGRTLMPGLIDAHVHATVTTMDFGKMQDRPAMLLAQEARVVLEGMLRRGFTTVRDAGGADWGLAAAVDRGLIRGPRIFFSGHALSQTGGHGDFRPRGDLRDERVGDIHPSGIALVADGVDAVRKAAREELRRGASQIKIMASGGVASPTDPIRNLQYSPDEMRAAVDEAASWHTYVMAHAYTPAAITRAVEAGVRTVEHGNLIDSGTAELMAHRGAYLVPTLVTYEMIAEHGRELRFPEASLRKVHDVLDAGLASLEIARRAGVQIGWGTDLLGETHRFQSKEFVIRVQVLPAAEILRSATVVNAEILGRSGDLGVVAEGATADMLLVDGDPLADISVLDGDGEPIDVVMKGGDVLIGA